MLSNGQRIAVKHIINDGHVETFVREVTSLSHVRHPNLVRLIGYCENHDGYFLVYELCHNGNLSEWLFGTLLNYDFFFFFFLGCHFHCINSHSVKLMRNRKS